MCPYRPANYADLSILGLIQLCFLYRVCNAFFTAIIKSKSFLLIIIGNIIYSVIIRVIIIFMLVLSIKCSINFTEYYNFIALWGVRYYYCRILISQGRNVRGNPVLRIKVLKKALHPKHS